MCSTISTLDIAEGEKVPPSSAPAAQARPPSSFRLLMTLERYEIRQPSEVGGKLLGAAPPGRSPDPRHGRPICARCASRSHGSSSTSICSPHMTALQKRHRSTDPRAAPQPRRGRGRGTLGRTHPSSPWSGCKRRRRHIRANPSPAASSRRVVAIARGGLAMRPARSCCSDEVTFRPRSEGWWARVLQGDPPPGQGNRG